MLDHDVVASIQAQALTRNAHHEAGHAVAAVARGGRILEISLGIVDWSRDDEDGDQSGFVRHHTPTVGLPFVTFAGPYAEARWMVETNPEDSDLSQALEYVWDNNRDGDGEKYAKFVAQLHEVDKHIGLGPVGAAWEADWADELDAYWPAIVEIAGLLLHGESVAHDRVLAVVAPLQDS